MHNDDALALGFMSAATEILIGLGLAQGDIAFGATALAHRKGKQSFLRSVEQD